MVESSGEGVSFAAPITKIIFTDWLDDGGDVENAGTADQPSDRPHPTTQPSFRS